MNQFIKFLFFVAFALWAISFQARAQSSAKAIRGAAPIVQLASEPDANLIVDPPIADQLALGRVVVQYRTENLRILPVYGTAAKDVSPRLGHLHITVDNASWRWADASNEPIVINGFTAGTHSILFQLVDPSHKMIASKTITFTVPEIKDKDLSHHH